MFKFSNLSNLAVIFGGLAFYGQQTGQMNLFYISAGIAVVLLCVSHRDEVNRWERDDEIGRIERDRVADYDELVRGRDQHYDELNRRIDERND